MRYICRRDPGVRAGNRTKLPTALNRLGTTDTSLDPARRTKVVVELPPLEMQRVEENVLGLYVGVGPTETNSSLVN